MKDNSVEGSSVTLRRRIWGKTDRKLFVCLTQTATNRLKVWAKDESASDLSCTALYNDSSVHLSSSWPKKKKIKGGGGEQQIKTLLKQGE